MDKLDNHCWQLIVAMIMDDPDKDELLKGFILEMANPPEISPSLLKLYKDDILNVTYGYMLQLPDPKYDQTLVNEVLEVLRAHMKQSGMGF